MQEGDGHYRCRQTQTILTGQKIGSDGVWSGLDHELAKKVLFLCEHLQKLFPHPLQVLVTPCGSRTKHVPTCARIKILPLAEKAEHTCSSLSTYAETMS